MNIKGNLSFTDRIKTIIDLIGSADKLANNSGMSARGIGQYLAGKSDPTRKKLIALAEAAGVNIEWLATGVGPMREGERERFSSDLLAVIIEGLDELETTIEKKLDSVEKASIISSTYDTYSNKDLASKQTKNLIKNDIKTTYFFLASWDAFIKASLDSFIKTEKGREQAIKKLQEYLVNVYLRKKLNGKHTNLLGQDY